MVPDLPKAKKEKKGRKFLSLKSTTWRYNPHMATNWVPDVVALLQDNCCTVIFVGLPILWAARGEAYAPIVSRNGTKQELQHVIYHLLYLRHWEATVFLPTQWG